ncbi:MAG TPA: efflux transporter outer membrane subunit [Burkholderiales bacterium]|nr:efflux transporter outer membrane subunit [Burkholderiales bacterium]
MPSALTGCAFRRSAKGRSAKALVLIALASLVGCSTVGPDYVRPKTELPAQWQQAASHANARLSAQRWWTIYNDPVLDRLIDESLAHNADLEQAIARVDEARALLGVTRADQFPEVTAGAVHGRSRISEVGPEPLPPGTKREDNLNRVTLNVAYEVDLWGRYRRATEAARAELLASRAAQDAVRLALTALVAQGYYALVGLDAQVEITQRTIATRRAALDLQRLRLQAGTVSEFDLRQTEAELAAAQALLPTLERARTQQQNALAVLLGRSPRAIVEQQIPRNAVVALPPIVVPAGLPSDLLERRPDIQEAEQTLVGANARIGVARAAYFPSIVLTGVLGSESAALSDLFSGPAGIWQLAASVTQPIFNAGRIKSQVRAASARQRQALAQYRLAIQNAFRDVQDALAAQSAARTQFDAEAQRVSALEQALKLARLRYDNGVASLLDVLDAERNLLTAELNRVDALRAQRAAVADTVKALGGGWDAAVANTAATAPTPPSSAQSGAKG